MAGNDPRTQWIIDTLVMVQRRLEMLERRLHALEGHREVRPLTEDAPPAAALPGNEPHKVAAEGEPNVAGVLLQSRLRRATTLHPEAIPPEKPAEPAPPKAPPPAEPRPHVVPPPIPTLPLELKEEPPEIAPLEDSGPTSVPPAVVQAVAAQATPAAEAAAPPPPPLRPAPPPVPPDAKHPITLENIIGLKLAAWVGGLVVVGGVLFFLKLAWDQGWIRPTPLGRTIVGLFCGAGMIGLGEWLHVKRMRVLSATLMGAGLAVVMATLFGANTMFVPPVLGRNVVFISVLLVGVAGIALSLHVRLMTLTVIALLGMYISPAILHSDHDASLGFLLYLGAVTAMGLGVALLKRSWLGVRWLSFCFAWLWLTVWIVSRFAPAHRELGFIALAVCFGMFLAEAIAALQRGLRPPEEDSGVTRPESFRALALEHQVSLLTFVNTAMAFALSWAFTGRLGMSAAWVPTLALAGVMAMVMFATPSRSFNLAALIQAAALVTVAVPLYFSASAITMAWAALSAALLIYGYLTAKRAPLVWSFVLLCLVVARLFTFDLFHDGWLALEALPLGRQGITRWELLGWGVVLYGFVASRFTQAKVNKPTGQPTWINLVVATESVAAGTLVLMALGSLTSGSELALIQVLALGIAGMLLGRPVIIVAGVGVLLATCLRIFSVDQYAVELRGVIFRIGRQALTWWLILAWAAAAVAEALAWLARPRQLWGRDVGSASIARVCALLGTGIFGLAGVCMLSTGAEFTVAHALLIAVLAFSFRSLTGRLVATLVLLAAMVRVVVWDGGDPWLGHTLFHIGTQSISGWLLATVAVALCAQILIALAEPRGHSGEAGRLNAAQVLVLAISSTMCIAMTAGRSLAGLEPLTLALIIWTFALLGLARLIRGVGYEVQVLILTLLLTIKCLLVDGPAPWNVFDVAELQAHGYRAPLVNLFTLNVGLLALLVVIARVRDAVTDKLIRHAQPWFVFALVFGWLNFEALRTVDWIMQGRGSWIGQPWIVRNVTLSVLWAIVGFGCVAVGFARRHAATRWVGLILLGITTAKVLLIDMANVQTVLRVLAMMVTGVLLLAVSYLYHVQVAKLKD